MFNFIKHPYLGIAIFFVLAILDYPLTAIARSSYLKYKEKYVEYRSLAGAKSKGFSVIWLIVKIVIVILLYIVWFIHITAELKIAGVLFLWLLGFAIGLYLIINLRHIESILLSRLYVKTDMLEGRISYHPKFSVKTSAVQLLTLLLIFCFFTLLNPSYFKLGLASAPLFLIIRNLLISHT